MSTNAFTALAVAPRVTFTPLPFGGAVLVNGCTLDLVECDEQTAEAISTLLLRSGARPSDGGRVARLVDDGWLVPVEREVPR